MEEQFVDHVDRDVVDGFDTVNVALHADGHESGPFVFWLVIMAYLAD